MDNVLANQNQIERVLAEGFRPYNENDKVSDNSLYLKANSICIEGIGRYHSAKYKRFDEIVTRDSVQNYKKKDSGKLFMAFCIQCKFKKSMITYIKDDFSMKTDGNTSELETQMINKLTGGKCMILNGRILGKSEFIDDIIYPEIVKKCSALAANLVYKQARDGDTWYCLTRHAYGDKSRGPIDLAVDEVLDCLEGI